MERKKVQSKQIESVGYDRATETLEIEFVGRVRKKDGVLVPGAIWRYAPVPLEVVQRFAKAESKGRFFGYSIRNQYPAIKIFPVESEHEETQKQETPAQASLLENQDR